MARVGKSSFFARALRGRCPQCGAGLLFRTWARLAEACSRCGLVYRRESGAQTGSMYLSAAVTQVFAAAVIFAFAVGTDRPAWRMIAVGLPLVLAFCAFFLPRSMALWVAVEYATDVGNGEPWVAPRTEAESREARDSTED